jgi:hypothetical protein
MPLQHEKHETGHDRRLKIDGCRHSTHNARCVKAAPSMSSNLQISQGPLWGMKARSRPGPNGRCRFGQETFAGVRGNGRDTPKAAVPHDLYLTAGSPRSARRSWVTATVRNPRGCGLRQSVKTDRVSWRSVVLDR